MRAFIAFAILLLAGCAPSVYYVVPRELKSPERQDSVIRMYAPFIGGRTIFVDPGHGGDDRANHGPEGDVIEADVNLRYSLYLADFLRRAGAKVVMSREKDATVTLSDRPRMSNASGADIFISIHHNATGTKDNETNFTSVWYHAREGDPGYSPANQDIARYIQRDLAYAMGNPGSPNTFDGTLSDYTVYPNAGFAVLRLAAIPAVLVEGSFFSSAYEEQRLRLDEFNKIEAWATFKGLCRYLKAGIPNLTMRSDSVFSDSPATLEFEASDASGIDPKSVCAKIDGRDVEALFDRVSGRFVVIGPADLPNGSHTVDAAVRNMNGNASFPFRRTIVVRLPVDSLSLDAEPQAIPSSHRALASVIVRAYDRRGMQCADGTEIALSALGGTVTSSARLRDGWGRAYLTPDGWGTSPSVTASADGKTAALPIAVSDVRQLHGAVYSADDSLPLAGAAIVVREKSPDSSPIRAAVRSYEDGQFILTIGSAETLRVSISRNGYYGMATDAAIDAGVGEGEFRLSPVARGLLHNKRFAIDARYGGNETGSVTDTDSGSIRASDVNMEIARALQQLMVAAGATVLQVRKHDIAVSDELRAKYASSIRDGTLLVRIDVSDTTGCVGLVIDPAVSRMKISEAFLRGAAAVLQRGVGGIRTQRSPLSDGVPFGAVSVVLPSVSDSLFTRMRPYGVYRSAWAVYYGLLLALGLDGAKDVDLTFPAGSYPPLRRVILDDALITVTASDGSCVFYGVSGSPGIPRLLDE